MRKISIDKKLRLDTLSRNKKNWMINVMFKKNETYVKMIPWKRCNLKTANICQWFITLKISRSKD